MSTQNRRSSFSSSTASSLAKRHQSVSSSGKAKALPPQHAAKKRPPLANVTNQNVSSSVASSIKIGKDKKEAPARTSITRSTICGNKLPELKTVNSSTAVISKANSLPQRKNVRSSIDVFTNESDGRSVSMDETMSSCDSIKSPEVEYLDNMDVSAVDSNQRKTISNFNISDTIEPEGCYLQVELYGQALRKSNLANQILDCDLVYLLVVNREIIVGLEREDKIVIIDNISSDPQLCATYVCDIYKHLRESEVKKRPSTDFMERIQEDINVSMRAILIDWLVEVAEEYRLVPETLYLTVNYIDRYLSGNAMNRQRLQLLGVSCMMIASKYEEICAPRAEEFCFITDNTYLKEEVLQMESAVLHYLKFEMTAPTVKCFLRHFVRAASQDVQEHPLLQLECLTNYIAELSLLEYKMLCYPPSLIAASAIFLVRFILFFPSQKPWNSTLQHYTLYRPSDLCACVKDLHHLCCSSHNNSNLPAIREKYSQHKYKCVAKKYIPSSIPQE
ncbi:Cyclin-A1-1, partial [Mucuna pruriens]